MSEMCGSCVLKDLQDSDVLFAVAAVQAINIKHANGYDWIEEAESLQNYPLRIASLHELGSTALQARGYGDEQLAPARMCAAARLTDKCHVSQP